MDGTYEGSKIVCIIKIAGLYVLYCHAEINSSSNERAKQKKFCFIPFGQECTTSRYTVAVGWA